MALNTENNWNFEKSEDKKVYNDGDKKTDSENPVWTITNFLKTPISDHHIPCGYWFGTEKEYS